MKFIKKCKHCVRFVENDKDAIAKCFDPIFCSSADYSRKPRRGVKTRCTCNPYHKEIDPNHTCKHWQSRLSWNLDIWWTWRTKHKIRRWYEETIRCRIGAMRKPQPLKWVMGYGNFGEGAMEPQCPYCGEMPYSMEQCVFCGQRFKEEQNDY